MRKLPKHVGCPTELALVVLGGKWKTVILAYLKECPRRYGELRNLIPRLSDKVLSERLAELETTGLIRRREGGEYELTPIGKTLRPVLDSLYEWGLAEGSNFPIRIVSSIEPKD